MSASPACPARPSIPVWGWRSWACTTSRTRARVKAAKTRTIGTRVQGLIRSSGRLESMSIIAPRIMATSPPTVNRPYDVTLTSAMNRAMARMTSRTPAQLTGMIWLANRKRMRQSTPRTPGKMSPGWLISVPSPASAPSRRRKRISGVAMNARMAWRQSILTSTVFSPWRCRVTVLPSKRVTSRPSSWASRSGTSFATRSISPSSRASVSVKDLLSTTAFSAISALRPRRSALPRM